MEETTKYAIVGTAADGNQQLSVAEGPTQPINNQSIDMEKEQNMIDRLKRGERISVAELKANGIILVRVPGFNRAINKNHVKSLVTSVKDVQKFIHPVQVITAEEYFQHYPDRKIEFVGKAITKDSPDVKQILVILDGQHRDEAESVIISNGLIQGYTPTLMAEYVELNGMTPDRWIIETNSQSRNWTSRDRTEYILAANAEDLDTNIAIARQWQKDYGMGERAAYAILTLNDGYRKACQVDYMSAPERGLPSILKGSQEQRVRGTRILNAFEVGFRNTPKMMKNMAAINLAIEKYVAANDSYKMKVIDEVILFFKSLDQAVAKEADAASGVANKQRVLSDEWVKVFSGSNPESIKNLEEEAAKAEEEWKAAKAATSKKTSNKAAKTKLP